MTNNHLSVVFVQRVPKVVYRCYGNDVEVVRSYTRASLRQHSGPFAFSAVLDHTNFSPLTSGIIGIGRSCASEL